MRCYLTCCGLDFLQCYSACAGLRQDQLRLAYCLLGTGSVVMVVFQELNDAAAEGSEEVAAALSRGAIDMTPQEIADFRQAQSGNEAPSAPPLPSLRQPSQSPSDLASNAGSSSLGGVTAPQLQPHSDAVPSSPPSAPSLPQDDINGGATRSSNTAHQQSSHSRSADDSVGCGGGSHFAQPQAGSAEREMTPLYAQPGGPAVPLWLLDSQLPSPSEQHSRLMTQMSLRMEGRLPQSSPHAEDVDSFYAKFMVGNLAVRSFACKAVQPCAVLLFEVCIPTILGTFAPSQPVPVPSGSCDVGSCC